MTSLDHPSLTIDYTKHPGFMQYSAGSLALGNSREGDDYFRALFAELDLNFKLINSYEKALEPGYIERFFKAQIDPLISEMAGAAMNMMPADALFRAALPEIFMETRKALLEECLYMNGRKNSEYNVSYTEASRKVLADLKAEGCSLFKLPAEYLNVIYELTAPQRAECVKKRESNPKVISSISIPLSGQYWELTMEIMRATGFMDGMCLYHQYQMAPLYCALHLSDTREEWYRNCYEDVGVPTSSCTYMHYDHDYDVQKVLMYLTDVDESSGPFSIVRGSNQYERSHAQHVFFKFLDQGLTKITTQVEDVKTPYYRARFKVPKFRKEFLKLPKALQGTSHFGDDVLDDSELGKFLCNRELKITSDIANCFTFYGSETMHRGGMVQKGHRWVFQMAFRKPQ